MARFDRRNTEQHDNNMTELRRIGKTVENVDSKVEKIDERLDHHMEWHLDQ